MKKEAGHTFLAKLGKKRLRPGGKLATDWLINKGQFSADKKILEVACNMGTTTIELARTFGCQIMAIDLDNKALAQARSKIEKAGLSHLVTLENANAMKLPFADGTFDIVINEAMLTMQSEEGKAKCLQEYLRVLKRGGVLLTHDVMLKIDAPDVRKQLSHTINVQAKPLTLTGWTDFILAQGFSTVENIHGDMTLMSLRGMIYDEGILGTAKIAYNALKKENREQFLSMFNMFKNNKKYLGFVAFASHKA